MTRHYRYTLLVLALLVVVGARSSRAQEDTLDDRDVKLVSFADLDYPGLARSARVQGVVVVRVGLDDQGRVASASGVSGPKVLVDACLANARKWTFKPNARKSAVIIYEFSLDEGACHDASRSLFRLRHFNFASITACTPVIVG
jgi:TonB family protein